MKRVVIFFLLVLAAGVCRLSAAPAGNVDIGPSVENNPNLSENDNKDANRFSIGIQRGIRNLVLDKKTEWLTNLVDEVGTWCLEMLFKLYDKFIGTFLIGIPDFANKNTYSHPGAPAGGTAASVVGNIYKITWAFGLFLLVVLFVAYIATASSGLSKQSFSPVTVFRFVIVAIFLFAWGPIFSFMTNAFTAFGYYIYSQNTLTTKGVFSGLRQMNLERTIDQVSPTALMQIEAQARNIFLNSLGMTWNLVYFAAMALVIIGIILGASYFSQGAGEGKARIIKGLAAVIIILALPTLLNFMVKMGAPHVGKPSGAELGAGVDLYTSDENLAQGAKPVTPHGVGRQVEVRSPDDLGQIATDTADMQARAVGGIIKILVAVWGVIIVITVLFAKIFQLLSLFIIFLLGPVFIGLAAHPSTANISYSALRFFIKLLSYTPLWGLTLVALYIIPYIDFGINSIGVNSILTAFAVLGGLQLIANTQEFASLFAQVGGANLSGEGWKGPWRSSSGLVGSLMGVAGIGAKGATAAATAGGTAQAGAAAGAVAGATLPGVGKAAMAVGGKLVSGMTSAQQGAGTAKETSAQYLTNITQGAGAPKAAGMGGLQGMKSPQSASSQKLQSMGGKKPGATPPKPRAGRPGSRKP